MGGVCYEFCGTGASASRLHVGLGWVGVLGGLAMNFVSHGAVDTTCRMMWLLSVALVVFMTTIGPSGVNAARALKCLAPARGEWT